MLQERTADVVIVGAGPAGSATAIFLARRGYDVALLERARFPREKPCGEYLTPGAVDLLRDELGVLPTLLERGATPLSRETVATHGGRTFSGTTEALACPRSVTDLVLRDAAAASGVTVLEDFAVRRIVTEGKGVRGVIGRGESGEERLFRAWVTVGADGTRSLLARTLGVVRPIPRLQRIALVGHYQIPATEADPGVTMYLPADETDACCGVGATSGPENLCNVNIVVPLSEASAMAGRREAYFAERLRGSFPQVWERARGAAMVGALHTVGCFGHHTTRAAHDGAVLVGDAATFVHPFTGEGVYFALRGGQMAAEAIEAAFRHGDTSARQLRRYDAARRRELLPRYRLCDAVQRIVHSPPLLRWAAARLRRSDDLTDAILRTVGDRARPADLFSLPMLRLALASF